MTSLFLQKFFLSKIKYNIQKSQLVLCCTIYCDITCGGWEGVGGGGGERVVIKYINLKVPI